MNPLITFLICLFALPLSAGAQEMVPPDCYGGMRQFRDFFAHEVIYPEQSLKDGVRGEVVLLFVVEKDGSTRDLKVFKAPNEELANEAKRIFNKLMWLPARYKEAAFASEHILIFRFSPARYRRACKRRGYESPPPPIEPNNPSPEVLASEDVDVLPEPIVPGGMPLHLFLNANVEYPEAAYKNSIAGDVKLYFVVEPNGTMSNVRVRHSLGGGCNEESMRVLRQIKWKPGWKDGYTVRTGMEVLINFTLPETDRASNALNPDYSRTF